MGTDMLVRDLYLPAGTELNLVAARATIGRLCRDAALDDLRMLLEQQWIGDSSLTDADDWSDQVLPGRVDALRATAEQSLRRLLEAFAASLRRRDVARFRFDSTRDNDTAMGVDAYVTGGLSAGDGPTDAFDMWAIVLDTDRFPPGWPEQIGAACGLLHPYGDGPAATTVTFRRWAAPAPDDPAAA